MVRNERYSPAYVRLGVERLRERSKRAKELLSPCRLCPRKCGVDRLGGELGFCKTGAEAFVSSRNIHHGEEPPISGSRGSGTIFFAHCNLRCVFCQNYPISHIGVGERSTAEELADMMLNLQERGAHNINFVTPSHVVAAIIAALAIALEKGLNIPLVYNSGGYDSLDELSLLDGVVDVYMPDAKYADNDLAKKYSGAGDYVEVNRAALREMRRQVGALEMDDEGIARRGLLIRHLVLPEGIAGTEEVMRFIAQELSPDTYVSLMSQYFPANRVASFPEVNRKIEPDEYSKALEAMEKYGLSQGFVQGGI